MCILKLQGARLVRFGTLVKDGMIQYYMVESIF